jgi:prolyl-tRNA editing enzyme YbaK/EbsC (Cys-tRNA(Pro) deacylase)
MSDWPEPVERVASFLRSAGAESVVEEFAEGTPTAEDAAKAVGAERRQIVKSLVFICGSLNLLVMVPGDRRADGRKIAAAAGCEKARVAGPELVVEATGFEPGAVAPFPLRRIARKGVDRSGVDASHGRDRTVGPGAPLARRTPRCGGRPRPHAWLTSRVTAATRS